MLAAHDRSRNGQWEGTHGRVLPEVDPTDETTLDVQKASQPERRLLLAILADAIVRCRRLATAPRHAALELREAERWIRSDDREWPCSFVNVCEALDIAYGPLRRAVLAWRRKSDGRTVTRRALLMKKRRKRSAGAVPAYASAGEAESGAASPAPSSPGSRASSPDSSMGSPDSSMSSAAWTACSVG